MISIQKSNKDVLAKLMAMENITVIHKNVPTAYFDVKSRTLCCPILKEEMSSELYDLFTGHEVSHALNTPAEGWHDKVSEKGSLYKGYLNVIEDVRIEKMIKAKYPGLRKSFYTGYNELANMNFFGTQGKNLQELNLIDRINLSYKIGSFAQIEFSKEEEVYINRCDKLETFEDVMKLADDLFEKQQNETEEELESMTDQDIQDLIDDLGLEDDTEKEPVDSMSVELEESEEDSDTSGEGSDANAEDDENSQSSDGDSDASETEKSEESGEQSESESKGNEEGTEGAEGKTAEEKLLEEMNKSTTDEEFRKNEDSLLEQNNYRHEPTYHEINGRIRYENFIVSPEQIQKDFDKAPSQAYDDRIKKTVKNFQEDNKKIIGYMVKEFEMKKAAASYNRSWSSKSGEIDMNKLAFYKLKEDIFNRVQVTPEGKNHGVVMTVDWSGSMSGSVRSTVEQASLLSMFCRRLSIPFRLFAFSDGYERVSDEALGIKHDDNYDTIAKVRQEYYEKRTFGKVVSKGDETSWNLGELSLLEMFNEKMSNREFTKAMENWLQLASSLDHRYHYGDYSEVDYDTSWYAPSKLSLSGTPLDHTIIAMRDYLVDFRKECNIDIASFIVLSDGASHGCFRTNNPHILDRALNKTFKLEEKHGRTTHGLMTWIGETANCRTIGFYITTVSGSNFSWDAHGFCGTATDQYGTAMEDKRKEFMKLSTSFTDGCYDLAILINQRKLKLDVTKDVIDVEVGANKGTLKRALVKAGTNKMQQRVILNQFVGQMAV